MKREPRGGLGRKAGQWYSAFALHFSNVLLFLLLANIALCGAFAIRDGRSPGDPGRTEAAEYRKFKETYGDAWIRLAYPGWEESTVAALYLEWGRLAYEYEPFTQLKVAPMRGSYINVSEQGFRRNGGNEPWPPDEAAFNVFVFGGSTAFGVGLPDDQTIPAALERQLGERSCPSVARVYNFGRPGYYSVQEGILFEQLLLGGLAPDVAVFIDGINDARLEALIPRYTDQLKQMVARASHRRDAPPWYASAREVLASLPMGRVAQSLRARFGRTGQGEETASLTSPSIEVAGEDRVGHWIANKRMVEAVAEQFGVRPLFVWQPIPTYHYDLTQHVLENAVRQWARLGPDEPGAEPLYVLMNERRREPDVAQNLLWLADMQLEKRENLYLDSLHYTAAFSDDIARAIGEDLRRRGWTPCAPRSAG
jgi:hypothetical protein